MKPLGDPGSAHLRRAYGSVAVGNYAEASRELQAIEPNLRLHPEVLKLRWEIEARAANWDECLAIADYLLLWAADEAETWLRRGRSLHKLGLDEAARDCLLAARPEFPRHPGILYDLAVYECLLGRVAHGRTCLDGALALDQSGHLKLAARQDPRLNALRKRR